MASGYEQGGGHSAEAATFSSASGRGLPSDPLHVTKSGRTPSGMAIFAWTHNSRMLIPLKRDFSFERQACAFQDDFRADFVAHGRSTTDCLSLLKMLYLSQSF